MSTLPYWLQVSTALLPPVIAAGVAFVAYQQWVTARRKLSLDLFDKRFAVFMDIRKLASEALQLGALTDVAAPNEVVAKGRFLFGPEVEAELLVFHAACTKLEVRDPNATVLTEASFQRLTDLMRPYLTFSHRH